MKRKTGVYLIGALGSIATTVVAGAIALRRGLTPPTGMITASDIFDGIGLIGAGDLAFGGCDIRWAQREDQLYDFFETMPGVSPRILCEVKEELEAFRERIDMGTARNCGDAIQDLAEAASCRRQSLRSEIEEIRANLRKFKQTLELDRVIVVNLASTEPPLELKANHLEFSAFEQCLDRNETRNVRASTLYSYAAIQEECPYINFTPSNGALIPALVQRAEAKGVPVMGNDGKTGETLVKSALAPMFGCRNLEVMSWEGFNILGNMDGKVLDNPQNRESKIKTKDQVISKILGYTPHSRVHIDYVPSLDDQKTAWDFIHFRGFLGVKMMLQFIWQGYDSILAAPLVLDMVRLAEFAQTRGESGLMPHLACFFKAPVGVDEHRLSDQFRLLLDYAAEVRRSGKGMQLAQ